MLAVRIEQGFVGVGSWRHRRVSSPRDHAAPGKSIDSVAGTERVRVSTLIHALRVPAPRRAESVDPAVFSDQI